MPKLSAHVEAQVLRFVRLFVVAFVSSGILLRGAALSWDAVGAAVIGALEVAWRQVSQVAPVAAPVEPPAPPAV